MYYLTGIEDDEDLEEADLETAIKAIKKKGGKIHQKISDSNPNTPENKVHEKKKKPKQKTPTLDNNESQDVRNSHGESSESSSDSDSDDSNFDENEHYPYRKQKRVEKEGYEEVPASATTNNKAKKRPILSPEELALGEQLISTKKRRRELEDAAWNRYMFVDRDK